MKTLIYRAGPLGSLYARLLHQAGKDVAILARNKRYDFIKENGVVLVNEFTGEKEASRLKVVDKLAEEDAYDLIVVLIRKNKLLPVFQVLSRNRNVRNILFMGNNALAFDEYLNHLPRETVLFGFPGAGGGRKEQVVHYINSEKPGGKRMPIRIGEMDGEVKGRTRQIKLLFESGGIPVDVVKDMDGWLKYHAALVIPIACVLYKHDCDNYALAKNGESIRLFIRACREGGNVLRKLVYIKRQPFNFNLFYWMPEFTLTKEFKILIDKTSVKTPNVDMLRSYIP